MNILTKENKGITLVILVLTIIILLIITGTITSSAIKAYKDAQVTEFILKMQTLQAKVDEEDISQEEINNLPNAVEEHIKVLNEAEATGEISKTDGYKYISKEELLKIFELENIDDIDDEFLINFETREIVSLAGIEYEDKVYYTQYLLPGAQTVRKDFVAKARDCDFNCNVFIKDKKAEVEVYNVQIGNGTLSYQEEGDSYWTTVANFTNSNDTYNFTIEKTGTYNIKIKDNTSNEEFIMQGINIALINFPELEDGMTLIENENLSEENLFIDYDYYYDKENESWNFKKWLYAEKDSEYYVWLPRFAYRINEEKLEVEYIKDDSNIATTNTYINLNEDVKYETDEEGIIETYTWKIPLKYSNEKSKGAWIRINSLNVEDLNLKDLVISE